MSRKSKSACVRVCVYVCCVYCAILCVSVCGLGRQENCRALFFCFLSLSYLHSRGVQSFACAVLLRRLNTSPPPSVSLSPPTLPPSLSLSLFHQLHACCMRSMRRPPSSLSSSSSLLPLSLSVYHSAFFLNLFLPLSSSPSLYLSLNHCVTPHCTLVSLP